jgi:hypothetical protein
VKGLACSAGERTDGRGGPSDGRGGPFGGHFRPPSALEGSLRWHLFHRSLRSRLCHRPPGGRSGPWGRFSFGPGRPATPFAAREPAAGEKTAPAPNSPIFR